MAGRFQDLLGTVFSKFQIGIGATAVNLKEVTGKLRARNKADSADAPIVGSIISASGDVLELNEDATSAGADWKLSIARPAAGMTAAMTLTLPPTVGSVGQALTTDGATGALSWTSVATGTDKTQTDNTSIAFGSAATVAMYNHPANGIVKCVSVIVDTPFNGAPTVSVGVAGTLSKYLASNQVDLTFAGTTTFEVEPGQPAVGSVEAIIATFAAGGATVGAARILTDYTIPS